MIQLPDFTKKFDYENGFYLTCSNSRIAKAIAQYELFKKTIDVEGAIVECGVFKGASFSRFAAYRSMFGINDKLLVAFDSFDQFPQTSYEDDVKLRERFILDAGSQSISKEQLFQVLLNKNCDNNVELVAGDIVETVPSFVGDNPGLKISLLNLDVDIYEPTVAILEYLFPLISPGGIIILDDYGNFPGETNAVDEFVKGRDVVINKNEEVGSPYYIQIERQ